jgi:hypothetical protein
VAIQLHASGLQKKLENRPKDVYEDNRHHNASTFGTNTVGLFAVDEAHSDTIDRKGQC